jgi:uncharacterized protein YkwD
LALRWRWQALVAVWLVAGAAPGVAAPGSGLPADTGAYAQHLALLINDYRARNGLPPLELAPELSALALEHAAQMGEHRRLSHDGFRDRFDRTHARICL